MEELKKQWLERLNSAQAGHYLAYEEYALASNVIGYILVISSALVSAFMFFSPSENQELIGVAFKGLGVIVAILAPLQTFMRPAEKAEIHRAKAAKYGNLKRRIEKFCSLKKTESEWDFFSSEILVEWNGLAEDSPVTPNRIRKKLTSLSKTF